MEKTFYAADEWGAIALAEEWCRENGISVGRMCGNSPIGIKRGAYTIQKWRNLSSEDIARLDGTIEGDFRNGPVTVNLKD